VLIMRRHVQRGFNLIELMTVVGLIAILMLIGMPSFQIYTQNAQTRTGAEALIAGMQLAKSEAIRRNEPVQMQIINASTAWQVALGSSPDTAFQSRAHEEGSANAVIQVLPNDADTISFNGFGRVTPNADGSQSITQITVDNAMIPNIADRRPLRIVVPPGGAVKLCDPNVALTDPRTC
jgi:type IV fimbrial biogenesis protein FimT